MARQYSIKNLILGSIEAAMRSDIIHAHAYVMAREQNDRRTQRTFPAPSHENGYYSRSTSRPPTYDSGRMDYFVGLDGQPTSERPHVHVNQRTPQSAFHIVATDARGRHLAQEDLPFNSSGNDVNAAVTRLLAVVRSAG